MKNELGLSPEFEVLRLRREYLRGKCAEEVEEYMHLTTCVGPNLCKTQTVGVGSPLVLKREPKNEHDGQAIRVETPTGDRIGWVPRKYNDILARLMDAGKLLVAKVSQKELEDHWLDLRIGIYLKDF